MSLYITNVDGRGLVESKEELYKDDWVIIKDEIYQDDVEVYKVRNVVDKDTNDEFGINKEVDLKFQKLGILEDNEEGNYDLDGTIVNNSQGNGRVNKNQTIYYKGKVGIVKDIKKIKGEPSKLVVEWDEIKEVDSRYIVYRERIGEDKEYKPFQIADSYIEADSLVRKCRDIYKGKAYFRL